MVATSQYWTPADRITAVVGTTVTTAQHVPYAGRLVRFQVIRTVPGCPPLSEFRVKIAELMSEFVMVS